MATPKDVLNYKFLKEALIQKYKHLNDPNFKTFRGISYSPLENPNSIFGRLYTTFRDLITHRNLLLNQYLNISDEKVLERLYLNLKKDPNLKFLDNPDAVLGNHTYQLPEEYYQEESKELAGARQEVAASEPVLAATSSVGSTPKIPNIRMPGTLIQQSEKGEKAFTMESKNEAGKQEVPQEFHKAFENEPDYKLDPTKQPSQPLSSIPAPSPIPPSVKIPSTPSFNPPKIPNGFINSFKNIASQSGIFFKKNIGKVLTFERAATGFGVLFGGFVGGVAGRPGVLFGAVAGGLIPSLVKSGAISLQPNSFLSRIGNGAINFGARISSSISGPRSVGGRPGGFSLVTPSKRIWLLVFMFLFGAAFLGAVFQPSGGGGQSGPTPAPQATILLDYYIPFRDSSVVPLDLRDQVTGFWPAAQINNWDLILDKSKEANWNPAFVLALWIEESGAQGTSYSDPLGCAVNQPTTDINLSLSCVFNNFSSFTNDQFASFMAKYSGGSPGNPFDNNRDFPKNIKHWYSRLVPSGPGALVPVVIATSSCPVSGGKISTPSFQADPVRGHCGSSYGFQCRCGTEGRRAKAIDVPTLGTDVVMPTINGQNVTWRLIVGPYSIDNSEGGGSGYTFETSLGPDKWYLDMLHLGPLAPTVGLEYTSGMPVAKSIGGHVHLTIGKNLNQTPLAGTATDCDPNWLPSDFVCR